MADERDPTYPTAVAGSPAPGAGPVAFHQLTQARVPLDSAGRAFTIPDSAGRTPIVIVPDQPLRIRNELVIGGLIAIVVALFLSIDLLPRTGLIAIGAVAIFLGVFQSFIVAVPEGARAMLQRSGRFSRTVGPGRHVVPPWIIVSHVVTVREIPFEALAAGLPTGDDVRVDLDLLMTFTIATPEKFVFAISAPDFDQVCQAGAIEAVRELVRGMKSDVILDVAHDDASRLAEAIGETLAPYGVEIQRVVITHVRAPAEFMASREARRLAVVQRDEQTEVHALQERRQADTEALARQRISAQRERLELEAQNEALRLKHLEERLGAYPAASSYDVLVHRFAVAEALAGNTRAMVHVGSGGDVADALLLHTLGDDGAPAPNAPVSTPTPPERSPRGSRPT